MTKSFVDKDNYELSKETVDFLLDETNDKGVMFTPNGLGLYIISDDRKSIVSYRLEEPWVILPSNRKDMFNEYILKEDDKNAN